MSKDVNKAGKTENSCADAVPSRKNTPNQAKRDIRAFERFISEAGADWPDGLLDLGAVALLALKTLDQPDVPDVMVKEAAKDLANFTAAYAAHVAKGE